MVKANVIRAAQEQDVEGMTRVLNETILIGVTTAHDRGFDYDRMLDVFISPPQGISCYVVCEGSCVLGFQALKWANQDWPGENTLPQDWAIISTYVKQSHHGRGVGAALFVKTLLAARTARVRWIDATVRRKNIECLAFYASLGFEDYKLEQLTTSKCRVLGGG
ncbi:GNAT family N-acetyltransferase (plasmid) [Paracoccus liaowanqingii]|uniref:GNAT family N-acetyltransferase n=1 Tax=Paracoccus liaowanqingii TaxID=2560053 RepID=A0A4Y5ST05_9RHOB|nr:GNAT family N-acetyltransferase [Paracoccus liaowanqingii]QDA35936.1 GNAT family N-acetyltransferase [Paracoccus liaowanqingii]